MKAEALALKAIQTPGPEFENLNSDTVTNGRYK
jgi:hypothetical protein